MKIKLFNRAENRKLKEIKAIVIHWDGGGVSDIDALWKWMNEKSQNSYHYLVSKDQVIQVRDTELRAIHCGHKTYTEKAIDFFGAHICSSTNSPNNYTLGVCMLHDSHGGVYYTSTMDSGIKIIADLCIQFNIDPTRQLLRHSDITDEKAEPCPKGFYAEDDLWCYFRCEISMEVGRQRGL